jgi:hypothetical protein
LSGPGGFFLVSLVGHWIVDWFGEKEHDAHGLAAEFNGYFIGMMRIRWSTGSLSSCS